jgi:hypothetical protein
MKRLLLIPALALSLGGCATLQRAVTAPTTIAAHTAADEEALKRCETTYKLTRTLMEIGVDSGLVKGAIAPRVAKYDTELYGALLVCRTTYRLFNSAALIQAADDVDKKAALLGPAMKEGAD